MSGWSAQSGIKSLFTAALAVCSVVTLMPDQVGDMILFFESDKPNEMAGAIRCPWIDKRFARYSSSVVLGGWRVSHRSRQRALRAHHRLTRWSLTDEGRVLLAATLLL